MVFLPWLHTGLWENTLGVSHLKVIPRREGPGRAERRAGFTKTGVADSLLAPAARFFSSLKLGWGSAE